jgi:hypothetical protein
MRCHGPVDCDGITPASAGRWINWGQTPINLLNAWTAALQPMKQHDS